MTYEKELTCAPYEYKIRALVVRIKGQLFLMLQCLGEKHYFYYPLFCKKNMVLKPSNVKNNVSSIKFPVMMLETIVSNISCIF